jgi:hypothetical protein
MEWEDEETWLRRRPIRLRTIWRFAKDLNRSGFVGGHLV